MAIRYGTIFLTILYIQYGFGFNFTKLKYPIGAFLTKIHDTYISYNNWRLLYYYDLHTYYENIDIYQKSLQIMEDICYKMEEISKCETIILKHRERFNEISNDLEYIKTIQYEKLTLIEKRKRRAPLGFLAKYLYKPIFGFMDEEDAEFFSNKINSLISNQKTQSIVLENHLSIVKQFIRITNETMDQFRINIEMLGDYINNYTAITSHIEKEFKQHTNFEYISELTSLVSANHERMTRIIRSSLRNTLQGDFTELIPHEQLKRDLLDISENIDESIFMIPKELKYIQQITSIKAAVKGKRLLIEINIPIINKSIYNLHKIIPLPMYRNNETIIFDIKNQNYLVDNQTKTYIPIDPLDLQNCKIIFYNALLCFPQTEMYFESQNNCESNILFEQDIQTILDSCNYKHLPNITYIQRLNDYSYFIYTLKDLLVRENCFKQASIFHTIKYTGILEIKANCEILTNGMKIFTKNTNTKETVLNITPTHKFINISIFNTTLENFHSKFKPMKIKYIDFGDNLNQLISETDDEIKRLHTQELITHIQYDITKTNIIYIIVAIFLFIFVKILYQKCC